MLGHEEAHSAVGALLSVSDHLSGPVHGVVSQSGQFLLDVSVFVFLLGGVHFLLVLGTSGQHGLGHVNVVVFAKLRQVGEHQTVVREGHTGGQQGLRADVLFEAGEGRVRVDEDRLLDVLAFDKDLHGNNLLISGIGF